MTKPLKQRKAPVVDVFTLPTPDGDVPLRVTLFPDNTVKYDILAITPLQRDLAVQFLKEIEAEHGKESTGVKCYQLDAMEQCLNIH